MTVISGLDKLINEKACHQSLTGNIGYLCHSASITSKLEHGLFPLKKLFKDRLKAVYSPQHGLFSDVQDNMVETDHTVHSYFKIPVYSLYSEVRTPKEEMLNGVDHLLFDLQDVGTRVYTYSSTLINVMSMCSKLGKSLVILDRCNPINAKDVEGNVLDLNFSSFVGLIPIPMRHGLTLGELGQLAYKHFKFDFPFEVIKLANYQREMTFFETGLPWVLPSPNLPTAESCLTFPATVLFEGTNMSEGRGTTRSLEIVGHPGIDPFGLYDDLQQYLRQLELSGFILRPLYFEPTFQKFHGKTCGGYQIHVTDFKSFKPWRMGLALVSFFRNHLQKDFSWKEPPYEYDYERNPFDLINGTDLIRKKMEEGKLLSKDDLDGFEGKDFKSFLDLRESFLLY